MSIHPEIGKSPKDFYFFLGSGSFIPRDITYYERAFEPQNDNLDPVRKRLSSEVSEFTKCWPRRLQEQLYYVPFCENEGLMSDAIISTGPLIDIKVRKPTIPFSEQTDKSLVGDLKWQNFICTHTPSRDKLLSAVKQLLGSIPSFDAHNIDLLDLGLFDSSMQIGGYKIALSLIPDVTDEEIKILFGNNLLNVETMKDKIRSQTSDSS